MHWCFGTFFDHLLQILVDFRLGLVVEARTLRRWLISFLKRLQFALVRPKKFENVESQRPNTVHFIEACWSSTAGWKRQLLFENEIKLLEARLPIVTGFGFPGAWILRRLRLLSRCTSSISCRLWPPSKRLFRSRFLLRRIERTWCRRSRVEQIWLVGKTFRSK